MLSQGNNNARSDQQWLLDACTKEIRAHRLIFLVVLCPLLGYWLPFLMFKVGMAVGIGAWASSAHQEAAGDRWVAVASFAAFILPLAPLAVGAWRERGRLALEDRGAAGGMPLPPGAQSAMLTDRVAAVWGSLSVSPGRTTPHLVCQPNFRVLAHAYDDGYKQTIEVSAGLAGRVVRDDALALSILRHEMAHLVYADLPAIRRLSIVAAAAVFSIDVSTAACLAAALTIVLLTDVGTFPVAPTILNVVSVHVAIALATLNVIMPLLIGRYAIRRYAGFCVALAEMRADVSAGIWGDGLAAFSHRLESDPTVAVQSLDDVGLAYLSATLSHFPARERAALLADPERLATPKLRYFAIAIVAIWLLAFHQGQQVWDATLLAVAVAFVQAITITMVLDAGRHTRATAWRAAKLAFGVLLAQALPLISIEGVVYLTQHLTAALVMPGGFGDANDADYWRDTVETFQEFGRFASQAIGGVAFLMALVLVTASFYLGPRLAVRLRPKNASHITLVAAVSTAAASFVVSHKFFQEALSQSLRDLAFRWSPGDAQQISAAPKLLQAAVSQLLYSAGDALNGQPLLGEVAWLRLALPNLISLTLVVAVVLPMLLSATVQEKKPPGAR
ncbi:MAG: hypothetical protein WAS21_27470 [Geminicoccaceae bacterium]